MRHIKLSGRESAVVRAIGFAEPVLGAEVQDLAHMEIEDVNDTINGLLEAGYVECLPYREEVELAEFPTIAFELNPAYSQGLRAALYRR